MTKKEKIKFIRELTASVTASIIDKIPDMPDEWDGIELRHYLADKFMAQCMTYSRGSDRSAQRRYREYKNTVLVTNL
jgi:hypothetical protein